jgi:membrane protease YdiL (CAAX protease family)
MPNARAAEQPTVHAAVSPRSMGLGRSLLFFGLPTAAAVISFYVIMPALIERGVLPFYAHSVALLLPLAGLLLAALLAYRLEGNPFAWPSLAERFRWRRMDGRAWLWTLGVWGLQLAGWFALQKLSVWLITIGVMPMPHNLPAFLDPRSAAPGALYDQAAGGLAGNWGFVFTSLAVLFFNIAGEELWWRGYVLPRQELAFGTRTWLVHGLLWTGFHAYKWWDLLSLLPLCLGLSYVVRRLQNNTPGLVMHTLQKADFFLVVVPLFLGSSA